MTKEFAKVPVEPLTQYMKDSHTTTMEMSQAMGVTQSGLTGWVRKGQMPKMALVALEGIKRRNGAAIKATIFVATVEPQTLAAFESFCSATRVHLAKVKVEP